MCETNPAVVPCVQMISAEAPVLFAKAAQIFITELTLRAWIHTEDNKRRTLQVTPRAHTHTHTEACTLADRQTLKHIQTDRHTDI